MENVDVHKITDAIGLDKRISPYFFNFGTPYGGTCFPRDTAAFIKFASNRNKDAKHLKFADEVNEDLYRGILHKCLSHSKIGIVGVSFKPDSPVAVGSPSAKLIEDLLSCDVEVFVYDELEESISNLNGLADKVTVCNTAQQCVDESEITAIMHPDSKFSSLDVEDKVIIDYWGIVNAN